MSDVLERLREENPVPIGSPPPFDEVWARATGTGSRGRRRTRELVIAAIAVAPVLLVVVFTLGTLRGRSPAGSHVSVSGQIVRGPVVSDGRVYWAEQRGRALVVLSRGPSGPERVEFESAATPGLGKNQYPQYDVSLAVGDGEVALLRRTFWNGCPHGEGVCPSLPPTLGLRGGSVTLLAGPPGHVRPIEIARRCAQAVGPDDVAVSDAGLVLEESSTQCGPPYRREFWRIVLRSFTGRLIRVLAHANDQISSLSAAGPWVAFVVSQGGANEQVIVMRADTGRIAIDRRGYLASRIVSVVVDAQGHYAMSSQVQHTARCGTAHQTVSPLFVGSALRPGLRTLWGGGMDEVALADGRVVFLRARTHCPLGYIVAVTEPGRPVTELRGLLGFNGGLSTDGSLVADGGAGASRIEIRRLPPR
jgi:hypothetical protein